MLFNRISIINDKSTSKNFFSSQELSLLVVPLEQRHETALNRWDSLPRPKSRARPDEDAIRSVTLPSLPSIRRSDFESVINNGFVKGYDVARSVQQLLRVVARLLFFGSAYIIIGVYVHKTARQTCKCWNIGLDICIFISLWLF